MREINLLIRSSTIALKFWRARLLAGFELCPHAAERQPVPKNSMLLVSSSHLIRSIQKFDASLIACAKTL
jgi:hypothetical protein